MATTNLFYCVHRLAFSGMSCSWEHTVCSLSDWLPSLSDRHLSFLPVFSWLGSSFLFSAEEYSIVWMDQSLFVHAPTEGHRDPSEFRQL